MRQTRDGRLSWAGLGERGGSDDDGGCACSEQLQDQLDAGFAVGFGDVEQPGGGAPSADEFPVARVELADEDRIGAGFGCEFVDELGDAEGLVQAA